MERLLVSFATSDAGLFDGYSLLSVSAVRDGSDAEERYAADKRRECTVEGCSTVLAFVSRLYPAGLQFLHRAMLAL